MESETFKMRKQFLEEFYNEDRVKFLNACNISVKNNRIIMFNEGVIHFITNVIIHDQNGRFNISFKNFCKFLKPFIYFVYSITYREKFLQDFYLFFRGLDISCSCDNENLKFEFVFPMILTYDDIERLNFLKTIKIHCLNDSFIPLSSINMTLQTFYKGVNHEQYITLGGVIPNVEMNFYKKIKDAKLIINSSQTFKSVECVICLTNRPNVLFCNCGHIAICSECEKIEEFNKCPICKTENEIIRILE